MWVYYSHTPLVGWRFFSKQPKPVLTLRNKNSPVARAWRMLRIPIAHLLMGLVPCWRRWRSCLQFCPRSWQSCMQVSPLPVVEPSTWFRVNRMVTFVVALKLLSFSLSYLLTARNGSVFFLGRCQVLVMQSFAFSFRLSKVGSLIEWLLSSSFCIYRENPMLPILNSLSSCSGVDVFLHGILSYNIIWCSFHPMAHNDFLYSSSAYHRESFVGWRPCVFSLWGLFKHLSRLVIHLLSFRRSMLHSTTAVLLDHIARDWGDVTVVLVELCWTHRRLHISSTAAIDYSYFPVGIAVKTLLFGRIFAKFEDLGVVQVGDQVLRFLNLLIFCVWLKPLMNDSLCLWFSNFSINLLTVLAYCILRLDCRKRYPRNSVIHGVVTSFPVTFRIARWFPRWSCFLALWILWTILRVRF